MHLPSLCTTAAGTRGTLTTVSIANDVAKYFAILPALFMGAFPEIAPLNVMPPSSPSAEK
jgi:K+-transporting ATPase ATPase B chain